jgi:hypothetical protein
VPSLLLLSLETPLFLLQAAVERPPSGPLVTRKSSSSCLHEAKFLFSSRMEA